MRVSKNERWICVRFDNRRLWTADLCEGETVVENIGGSYPKTRALIIDAQRTWGNLDVKILPEGITEDIIFVD